MKQQLEQLLGKGKIRETVDLFPYLSMRLHTTAQYFFEAQSKEDLIHVMQAIYTLKLPLIMLGGGSNAVFNRSEIQGLVVKNNYSAITALSATDTTVDIEVGSGTSMAVLVQKLTEQGLSGLEYHKGLPGTVGGAIYMNSKWTHPLCYVGDTVISAILVDSAGKEKKVDKEYFDFAYDYSILQKTHELLVSVVFRLQKKGIEVVTGRANDSIEYRKKTQPSGVATCGCFFRNISAEEQEAHNLPTKSAGYLIDKAGMKGVQIGSFKVSEVHANFIVNQGGDARPEDLAILVEQIKTKVKAQFGIILKEEVELL
jgi:UDP-N-acetylmuramate dehydrogenase